MGPAQLAALVQVMLLVAFGLPKASTSAHAKRATQVTAPELTRGDRKSQSYELTVELTSTVDSHYLSRSQWLQLPYPAARRRII